MCATATYCTENKGLLIAQPLPQSEESLCKQQAFGDSLCSASYWRSVALLQNLDTALCSSCFATNLGPARVPLPTLSARGTACMSGLCFHSPCDSSTVFSNVKLALWSLATAVNLHKHRYTACLPVHSRTVRQHSCCALHQRQTTGLSHSVAQVLTEAVAL